MSKHVAVLMGGWSSERQVSLWSGEACAEALRNEGFRVTEIDVGRDLAEVLGRVKPDVCFNALHGRFGEDGTVQGMLEVMGIPYTHSGVLASSLAMHKQRAKTVMAAAGVPVPRGKVVTRGEAAKVHVLTPPYVLKPVDGGSSVGVYIVNEDQEHPPQELTRSDWDHGELLLAENFVAGRELTCAVLNGEPLDVIEILPSDGWYDFDAKYASGGSRHILPAEISPFVYQQVRKLAVAAHEALGCRGVSRADFRFDDREGGTGELVCLEVNTQPGMTKTSLVPELAAYVGMGFGELVRWLVEDASLER
ncbi:D-alanine--D-alanine ligase [Chelatococcus sambhunathii]|uniref:D-alanine--D-alanine ligase n=1 Tax=Chelatococcus sambhunathii TaxID=363953 RepID=A0ABU1DHR5_9HYPH|nr:D-alanine--D-alanine ligase [Chelatococcus sambhunathii]MDR4307651.1 D-alanine--D-alanine ligase [Chelatococcus sambhunathii]